MAHAELDSKPSAAFIDGAVIVVVLLTRMFNLVLLDRNDLAAVRTLPGELLSIPESSTLPASRMTCKLIRLSKDCVLSRKSFHLLLPVHEQSQHQCLMTRR